jgi:carbon storage regulator
MSPPTANLPDPPAKKPIAKLGAQASLILGEVSLTPSRNSVQPFIYTNDHTHGGPAMLVLSRKESERIRLGDSIVVTVVRVAGDKVRLGIQAPPEILVLRDELQPHAAQVAATPADVANT